MADRLKSCKKPKTAVHCDIPAELVTEYADILAIPLVNVYNRIITDSCWPDAWKSEAVTVIPKCTNPADFSQLRNLSCTPVFSKVFEYFLLERLKSECKPSTRQHGGIKGNGTDHYLINAWNYILEALDDEKGPAVSLVSVDFAKAFNTMEHQSCLRQFRDHGASVESLRLIHTFLRGRKMSVKLGNSQSSPRLVPGGSPQGTLLGNFLFIIATDQLETPNNPSLSPPGPPSPPDLSLSSPTVTDGATK